MTEHERLLLRDIQDAGQGILQRTRDMNLEAFAANRDLQLIVERLFIIMGEAAARLQRQFPSTAQRISQLRGPIAFRNFLIHVYDQVDPTRVWNIVESHAEQLLVEIDALLREAQAEEQP